MTAPLSKPPEFGGEFEPKIGRFVKLIALVKFRDVIGVVLYTPDPTC